MLPVRSSTKRVCSHFLDSPNHGTCSRNAISPRYCRLTRLTQDGNPAYSVVKRAAEEENDPRRLARTDLALRVQVAPCCLRRVVSGTGHVRLFAGRGSTSA